MDSCAHHLLDNAYVYWHLSFVAAIPTSSTPATNCLTFCGYFSVNCHPWLYGSPVFWVNVHCQKLCCLISQWKTQLTFRILPYLWLALEDYKFGCEPVISHLTMTDTSIQYGGYFGETFQIYLFIQGFEVADLAGYSRSPSPQQCFPAPSRRRWPQVRRNAWSLRQFLSLSLSLRTSGCGQNNHKDRDL